MKNIFTIVIFAFSINAIAQVPTNGLVGYWPFIGNANDESGNENNDIVNGATLTADRFGNTDKAYSFDGQNDYITIPHSNSLNFDGFTSNYSICFWLKTTSSYPGSRYFISKTAPTYPYKFAFESNSPNKLVIQAWDGSNNS